RLLCLGLSFSADTLFTRRCFVVLVQRRLPPIRKASLVKVGWRDLAPLDAAVDGSRMYVTVTLRHL
ncbi:MAG TPA: hypothetical protein VM910_12845, partial [Bradyrhizobium sp.]|nr:hypothetical protein [Bradyrhizobium sp.]